MDDLRYYRILFERRALVLPVRKILRKAAYRGQTHIGTPRLQLQRLQIAQGSITFSGKQK